MRRLQEFLHMPLFALGVMIYIFSMITEVVPNYPGWFVLLFGWFHLVTIAEDPFVALAWLANPLLIAAWIFSFKRMNKTAVGTAGAALAFSALFLLGHGVLVNEAGGTLPPKQHGIGYDAWLASITIAFTATIVRATQERD
jgi:hypothetical protein